MHFNQAVGGVLWGRDERRGDRLIHEGLIYSSDEEYLGALVPFLREAVEAGQPALAALPAERWELVQSELGEAAGGVTFHDNIAWYRRPGAAIVAWTAALDEAVATADRFVRAVGEPPVLQDSGREERWRRYESLFNQLYTDEPIWIICPYDAQVLPEAGLDVCRHTHPTIATADGRGVSPEYFASRPGTPHAPLSEAEGEETSTATAQTPDEILELRRAVVWPGLVARLSAPDVQDLVLAVTELARAAFEADGDAVTVVTRRSVKSWACDVSCATLTPRAFASGRARIALAVGSIVADRLELDAGLVRFVFHDSGRSTRERILAAAEQLFGRQGIRRTTVEAIASRAKVAKATFYSHFASKDELARTWVQTGVANWDLLARAEVEARAESPCERLLAWFDVLTEWGVYDVEAEASVIRVWTELRDPANPAFAQYEESTEVVRSYLRDLAGDGASDPEALARELQFLAHGAVLEAGRLRSAEPFRVARAAAGKLVAASFPPAT